MNQITDLPGDSNFGLGFDYSAWSADARITLTTVPWGNDYRDWYRPDGGQSELDSYIDSRMSTNVHITNADYVKTDQPISINVPLNVAMQYNYVRVRNPIQPVPGGDFARTYYYFILGVRRNAPNSTYLDVELDVLSTYGYDVQFGQCFIERSHLPMAATNRFEGYGQTFLTEDEGIDLGGDYRVVRNFSHVLSSANAPDSAIIISTTDLTTEPIDSKSAPVARTAKGSRVQGLPTPVEMYVINRGNLPSYFSQMARWPHVTRGIISVMLVPQLTSYKHSADANGLEPYPTKKMSAPGWSTLDYPPASGSASMLKRALTQGGEQNSVSLMDDWRGNLRSFFNADVRDLDKFLTYPYTFIELTSWAGDPVQLKPELWKRDNMLINLKLSIVPGGERLVVIPESYGASTNDATGVDGGEFLDGAMVVTNFPKLPVLNDGAALALASTVHSRAAQRASITWGLQKTLAANELAYRNSGIGIDLGGELASIGRGTAADMTELGIQTRNQKWGAGAVGNVAQGAAGGLMMGAVGGPKGAALGAGLGAAGAAISSLMSGIGNQSQNAYDNAALAIQSAGSRASQNAQTRASNAIRGNNKAMADFAARGDYHASIAALNAQTRDMELTPPQMVGQFGGDAFNLVHGEFRVRARVRTIPLTHMRKIARYWRRYGYAFNRYGVPPADMHAMTKFTYWKLSDSYLNAAPMPELFKQAIRGIFEKGITVWKNADDIGNVDPRTNVPLPGITIDQ